MTHLTHTYRIFLPLISSEAMLGHRRSVLLLENSSGTHTAVRQSSEMMMVVLQHGRLGHTKAQQKARHCSMMYAWPSLHHWAGCQWLFLHALSSQCLTYIRCQLQKEGHTREAVRDSCHIRWRICCCWHSHTGTCCYRRRKQPGW